MNDINPRAQQHADIRQAVRDLCSTFDSAYWQEVEESAGYPEAFVQTLTQAGWLATLIPEEYGGGGASLTEASVILEEINRSGANSGACHAQMYIMGTLLRHGSPEQKGKYLPQIASGELRLQSFAVTGYKHDGTVVMTFRRTILVYKRGHVPQRPTPTMKELKE